MKSFGGSAIFLDRDDINTDEIIPAKYLTETSKTALQPHLLEDILLEGDAFDPHSPKMRKAKTVITRANFGCGSSREHAVWAFEVNDINLIIASSFARIFRQNMFNCGLLAIELPEEEIDALMNMKGAVTVDVDVAGRKITAVSEETGQRDITCAFQLNPFDEELAEAGGWLSFADRRY